MFRSIMSRSGTSRSVRLAALAALAIGGVAAVPHVAGATYQSEATSFSMTPLAKFVPCMAADGVTPPRVTVSVERGEENDRLVLRGRGFKPGIQFDLFTLQNSNLAADGSAAPGFKGFGMAWYQSDLHANENGRINTSIRTILLDQVFGLVNGGATPVPPTNTFHAGFWFNDPADAAPCGFTGTTPFNGEHAAGPLAFVTVPDATTNLGPLCVSPEQNPDGTFRCNP